jgi:hypothetical protein
MLPSEITLGIECRHAAEATGCDGLAIDMIRDVTGSKDAWNRGFCGEAVES